jgi:integrase
VTTLSESRKTKRRDGIRPVLRADGSKRWEVVVELAPDPTTGKRKQATKTCVTHKEAKEYRTKWLQEIYEGTAVDRSPTTVEEVVNYWLDTHARPRLRAKTVYDYERTIEGYIVPALGKTKVQELTTRRVQQFYRDLEKAGRGAPTIRRCHLHLNQALNLAVLHGLIPRNVAERATQPKAQPREMRVWTAVEAQAFMLVAPGSRYGPLWEMALSTGMRRGEYLGVRWRDIDLGEGALRVAQTVGSVKGRVEIKPPKTKASRRTIPLAEQLIAALKAHKCAQNERRLAHADLWQDNDLVFCTDLGYPINPDNITADFRRLVRIADVPRIRVHDLRHTYVTLALQAGVNIRVISELIGHSNVKITLSVYAHVMPEQRTEGVQKMGALLYKQYSSHNA